MYCVLECYPKPINVLTDTNLCLYEHQLVINLVITLHSFLTWGNKACNLNCVPNVCPLLFMVTATVTLTQQIYYYELVPWRFTCNPNDESLNRLFYLEVIVSEVVWLDSSDRLIGSGSVMTRLVLFLGLVSGKIRKSLPPVYITVRHSTLANYSFHHFLLSKLLWSSFSG